MAILGVDFGRRYIGLALSQGYLAEPLKAIENSSNVFEKFKYVVEKHEVKQIVLGLPEGILKKEAQDFGKEIKKRLEIPVSYVDEVFTTRQAQEKLLAQGKKREKRKEMIHAASAAIILESFLSQK